MMSTTNVSLGSTPPPRESGQGDVRVADNPPVVPVNTSPSAAMWRIVINGARI
jgi:hypothetical protein